MSWQCCALVLHAWVHDTYVKPSQPLAEHMCTQFVLGLEEASPFPNIIVP